MNDYTAAHETLVRVGTTVAQTPIPPAGEFCTIAQLPNRWEPGRPVQVPFAASKDDAIEGTDGSWNDGDTTFTAITVNPILLREQFGISNFDLQSGANLENLAMLGRIKFEQKCWSIISSVLTVANFGAAAVTVAPANFSPADFETHLASVSSRQRTFVYQTAYYAKIKPLSWLPVNFQGQIYETADWSSAGENIHGFVSGGNRGIVLVYGAATVARPGRTVMTSTPIVLPQLGIQVTAETWFDITTRSLRCSYSTYLSASPGSSAALKLLASA